MKILTEKELKSFISELQKVHPSAEVSLSRYQVYLNFTRKAKSDKLEEWKSNWDEGFYFSLPFIIEDMKILKIAKEFNLVCDDIDDDEIDWEFHIDLSSSYFSHIDVCYTFDVRRMNKEELRKHKLENFLSS